MSTLMWNPMSRNNSDSGIVLPSATAYFEFINFWEQVWCTWIFIPLTHFCYPIFRFCWDLSSRCLIMFSGNPTAFDTFVLLTQLVILVDCHMEGMSERATRLSTVPSGSPPGISVCLEWNYWLQLSESCSHSPSFQVIPRIVSFWHIIPWSTLLNVLRKSMYIDVYHVKALGKVDHRICQKLSNLGITW